MNLNLKSIVKRVTNVIGAQGDDSGYAAMADRVSTVSGCMALLQEYEDRYHELDSDKSGYWGSCPPEVSMRMGHLMKQMEEVRRVLLRRKIEEDMPRLDRGNKRELDAASRRVEAASTELGRAQGELEVVGTKARQAQTEVNQLSQELAELRTAAEKVTAEAETAFRAAFDLDQGTEVERKASDELRQARAAQAVAGADIELRLEGLRHRHSSLVAQEASWQAKVAALKAELADALLLRHEISSDMATRALIEAWAAGRAELETWRGFLPDVKHDGFLNAGRSGGGFLVFKASRIAGGAGLVHNGSFAGMDRMVAAFALEPDLPLLAGETEPTMAPVSAEALTPEQAAEALGAAT